MATHTPQPPAIDPRVPNLTTRGRQMAQRLSRLMRGGDDHGSWTAEPETSQWPAVPSPEEEEILARFPYARNGYDCAAVDEHVAGLEQELVDLDRTLAELRERLETDAVSREIKRLGEETSSVLVAAHEAREEMLREARAEADRRLAEAESQAAAMISSQEARARELQERNEALRHERDRLLEQVRSISTALTQVADSALEPQ